MRYAILIRLAIPLFFLFAWWRGRREPAWRSNWVQRLGRGIQHSGQPLWIHAASVGEVNSAQSLLAEIQKRWPQLPLLLTAFTPTGLDRLQELAPRADCRLLPLDLPRFWNLFLSGVKPRALIVLETECWPNLLQACHRREIPVLWLSARLGASSLEGMPRVFGRQRLARELAQVKAFAAQSTADATRFEALGAVPERIIVVGSLKRDLKVAPDLISHAQDWRQTQRRDQCWLAASTHPGEEAKVLAAHKKLLQSSPGALLLLAPRHPRRATEVRGLIEAQGLSFISRSQSDQVGEAQVYLIDTLGELLLFYAAADFSFVGGSMVDIGGHNLLEPAVLGKAMVTGPYLASCQAEADALAQVSALQIVDSQAALEQAVTRLAADPGLRDAAGQAAREYAMSLSGALEKSMQLLEPWVCESASDQ